MRARPSPSIFAIRSCRQAGRCHHEPRTAGGQQTPEQMKSVPWSLGPALKTPEDTSVGTSCPQSCDNTLLLREGPPSPSVTL